MNGLRQGLAIGALTFCLSMGAYAEESPGWFLCENDADCVLVDDGCMPRPVNKKYEAEAQTFYARENAAMDCVRTDLKKLRPVCAHAKGPCKKFFGMLDDPASTCVSAVKQCTWMLK